MPQTFECLSLAALADELKLSRKKLYKPCMKFANQLHAQSPANSMQMVKHDMEDCNVTTELCWKQDLINDVVAI